MGRPHVRACAADRIDGRRSSGGGNRRNSTNHNALNYAHAAAVVRGCAFSLPAGMSAAQLCAALPMVGPFTAGVMQQQLATGTSPQMEAFRADRPVRDSKGELRPGTAGAATCRAFCRLPGIGPRLAQQLYDAGHRTYEDLARAVAELEAAAKAGGGASGQAGGSGRAQASGRRSDRRGDSEDEDDEDGGDDDDDDGGGGQDSMDEDYVDMLYSRKRRKRDASASGLGGSTSARGRKAAWWAGEAGYSAKHHQQLLQDVGEDELRGIEQVLGDTRQGGGGGGEGRCGGWVGAKAGGAPGRLRSIALHCMPYLICAHHQPGAGRFRKGTRCPSRLRTRPLCERGRPCVRPVRPCRVCVCVRAPRCWQ